MQVKTRTVVMITGALTATVLAGVGAIAASPADLGGQWPAHMQNMETDTYHEMLDVMQGDPTMDEMHQWMQEKAGVSRGEMHRDMAQSGVSHRQMHTQMLSGSLD